MASTVRALREMISQYSPSILFLCETKAKGRKVKNLCNLLSFDHVFTVDPVGRSGGLTLFWKDYVNLSILQSCKNFIHSKVAMNDMNVCWYLTVVYGDTDPSGRSYVWDSISNLHVPNNVAWGCIEDFNEILYQYEKEGMRPHSSVLIENFRTFLDENSLADVELKGCSFTWSNNRIEGYVREQIDRLLVNGDWRMVFPDASLTALPAISSDHSPWC